MKKSSKLLLVLSLLGLGNSVLASCGTSANNAIPAGKVNEGAETNASYNIINASSEAAYLDGLPEKGVAHQSYSFRVSLKPGYHFNDKITITSGETTVSYTFKDSYYTFEMPEAEVAITVDVGKTDFTIKSTSYFVSNVYLDQEGEENVIAHSALPGTALKFEAHADEDFEFTAITMNGKTLEEGNDGFYHFSMPTRPAIISSDKIAVKYNVTMTSELALSTATIYTNTETKAAITQAVKDEKVYIAFTPKDAETQLKFSVSVKTVAEESESATALSVTEAEGNPNLFSFDMVSKNVEITVKEKDVSLYAKSELVGKAWKGVEVYGSTEKLSGATYDELDTSFTFDLDESCKQEGGYSSYDYTWTPDGTKKATLTYETPRVSNTGEAVLSEQILSIQYISTYSTGASLWTDTYFCLSDSAYELHYYCFNKKNRIVWAENPTTHEIVDAVLVDEQGVLTTGVTIKKEDGSQAVGTDITKISSFLIYKGETKLMGVSSGSVIVTKNITKELAQYTTCSVKDEAGNEITSCASGKTVTLTVGLTADAPSNLAVKDPDVRLANGTPVKVTKDGTNNGTYTFVMPTNDVTVKLETKDLTRFQGYPALGSYSAYEIYSYGEHSQDYDFSSNTMDTYTWDLDASGEVKLSTKNHSTGAVSEDVEKYEITSMENTTSGVISIVDNSEAAQKTSEIQYDNGLMVAPFSFGSAYRSDIYLGVKLPEGKSESDIKTNVHYKSNGILSCWAVSLFVGDELFGSVFCYQGTVYMGVTFTFDEGSTRIGTGSSYHVVKDGQTIYDVANNEFTAHKAN